jgi:hypothetical protein
MILVISSKNQQRTQFFDSGTLTPNLLDLIHPLHSVVHFLNVNNIISSLAMLTVEGVDLMLQGSA